ncbi:MAG: hypothetical protein EOM22_03170 [Gammaproteobacteria bacterium]|nr:hypothetical protein [Gammaproteobacteria bacterium]
MSTPHHNGGGETQGLAARGTLFVVAMTLMVLFGIPVERPESLEIQAVGMKLMAVAAIAAALNYWSLIDGRVAVMLVGGALGASAAWLLGFRQGRGRIVVVVQAIAAGVAAVAAELAWTWL